MSLIQTLGASLPMVIMFFGVVLLSVTTAIVALLADY